MDRESDLRLSLRAGRIFRFACVATAALITVATQAHALGPVDATVGYQYYSGAAGQTTWSPNAELESDFNRWSTSAEASHFDDNQSGSAWGITGGLKLALSPRTKFGIAGTGFAGDSTSGAWRIKAGPEFALALKDQTLGITYAHYNGVLGTSSNALSAEFDTPLNPKLSGSVGMSLGENSDGTTGEDGSVGLSWKPVDAFELNGEIGASKDAAGFAGLLPSRKVQRIQSGNKGKKGAATVTPPLAATVQLGVQVHF